jgi:hypothetical protein
MFGLSLSKILFTVGIIIVIWRGWKLMEFFRDKISDEPEQRTVRKPRTRKPGWFSSPFGKVADKPPVDDGPAMDLVRCPHCGAYVANGEFCEDPKTCPLNRKSNG